MPANSAAAERDRRMTQTKHLGLLAAACLVLVVAFGQRVTAQSGAPAVAGDPPSAMVNPYGMLENWPHLGDIKPGAAIGIVPDGRGGTWLHHRSEPPIIHFDSGGNILTSFG